MLLHFSQPYLSDRDIFLELPLLGITDGVRVVPLLEMNSSIFLGSVYVGNVGDSQKGCLLRQRVPTVPHE